MNEHTLSTSPSHFVLQSDGQFIVFSASRENVTEAFMDPTVLSRKKITPLLSDAIFRIMDIVLPIFLFTITSLFGIFVNVLNIIVYFKHGFQESIILGFFALSVSDLVLVACPLGATICITANLLYPESPVYFPALHFVSTGNLREMAYFYSNILTAFLSIERCCCIALPFKVKAIFTPGRSRLVILSLLFLVILGYAPTISTVELRWMPTPGVNDSKTLSVWFAPHHKETYSYSYYIMGIATPSVVLFLVICNTGIMIYGLQASSKFRKVATGTTSNSKNESETNVPSRETRLVKVMVFLGIILALCNLPYVVFVYAMYLEPKLEYGMAYHNMYLFIYNLCYLLTSVNASSNIFVYYKNSSRYRQIFDDSFRCVRAKRMK